MTAIQTGGRGGVSGPAGGAGGTSHIVDAVSGYRRAIDTLTVRSWWRGGIVRRPQRCGRRCRVLASFRERGRVSNRNISGRRRCQRRFVSGQPGLTSGTGDGGAATPRSTLPARPPSPQRRRRPAETRETGELSGRRQRRLGFAGTGAGRFDRKRDGNGQRHCTRRQRESKPVGQPRRLRAAVTLVDAVDGFTGGADAESNCDRRGGWLLSRRALSRDGGHGGESADLRKSCASLQVITQATGGIGAAEKRLQLFSGSVSCWRWCQRAKRGGCDE